MAQLVRAQVSYFRMTTVVGNPEVVSSILTPSTFPTHSFCLVNYVWTTRSTTCCHSSLSRMTVTVGGVATPEATLRHPYGFFETVRGY